MMKYSNELETFIKSIANGKSNLEIIELVYEEFGIRFTKEKMKCYKANHKISSGLTGHFEKGHVPMNKGIKGAGGWEPTYFKKGHIPANYRPIGSERFDSKDGYLSVKVADPNKWKTKHVMLWEEHNGKVPKGHKVIFLDGNIRNITIENLALVTEAQLLIMNRNKLIKNDPDITKSGILVANIISSAARLKSKSNKSKK